MNIPSVIVKADSVTWLDEPARDNSGNPVTSVDWILHYAIRGPTSLDLTATANGDGWSTTISSAQSGALTEASAYYWQAYVTKGSARITIGSGSFNVQTDLATTATTYDGRSQTRKDLDSVRAAMRAIIAGGAVQEYTIGNRSVRKMTMTDLITLESKLKADLAREEKADRIRNGLGNPHNLMVRFR